MSGLRPRLLATPALLLAAAAAAGCATGRAPARAAPEVLLPAPPAAPLLRLVAVLPDPDAPRPPAPWWRRALDVITGAEHEPANDPAALVRPFGVTFAPDGSLLVADPDAGRVVRFDAQARATDLACKDRPWSAPMALVATAAGDVYVADAGAGAVVDWKAGACRELGRGELERPTGLALVGDRVWVADPPRHQVVAFSPDGRLLTRAGERGPGPGQLQFPSALAATPEGDLLVVDTLNFRIVRLSPDGKWRSAFGSAGLEGNGFARPKAIAVDGAGRAWITDAQRDTLLLFAGDGAPIGSAGESGGGRGGFALPAGIAVHGGRLAVADSQNHRVQVFEIIGGRP